MLALPTRRATYHRALGSGELIPQNERELRCSEGSGMLIGDPLRQWFSNGGTCTPRGTAGVLQGVRERYHYIIIIRYPYHFTVF